MTTEAAEKLFTAMTDFVQEKQDWNLTAPTETTVRHTLRLALIREEFDEQEILNRLISLDGMINGDNQMKIEDFSELSRQRLTGLLIKKKALALKLNRANQIINLLFVLALAIAYFSTGPWADGLGFVGASLMALRNIYLLYNWSHHKHRVSPFVGFSVAFVVMCCFGSAVSFKIIRTIVKESHAWEDLSGSIQNTQRLLKNLQGEYNYAQNSTITDVTKYLQMMKMSLKRIVFGNEASKILMNELFDERGLEQRLLDFFSQILFFATSMLELAFSIALIY